jgi:hypothetical protein
MIDPAGSCTYNDFVEVVSGRQRTAKGHDRRVEREKEFELMRFENKVVLITGEAAGASAGLPRGVSCERARASS